MRERQIFSMVIILVMLVFVLASESRALQDFEVGFEPVVEISPCSKSTSVVAIENTGDELIDVSFSVEGKLEDFVSFSRDRFVVIPGQSRDVTLAVEAPCDGVQDSSIKLQVVGGDVEKSVKMSFVAVAPANVDIIPKVFVQTVSPCSEGVFVVSVVNPGSFAEAYSFKVSPFSSAIVSPKELILSAGEQKDVEIKVVSEDCSVFGELPVVFSARAEKTNVVGELDLLLLVKAEDVVTFTSKIDRIATNYSTSGVKVFVRNEGDASALYTVRVEGPGWVKSDAKTVIIDGGAESGFMIVLAPDASVLEGEYDAVVSLDSTISKRVYAKKFVIVVSDGTGVFEDARSWFGVNGKKGVILIGILLVLTLVKRAWRGKRGEPRDEQDLVNGTVTVKVEDGLKAGENVKSFDEGKVRREVEQDLRKKYLFLPKSSVISPSRHGGWLRWLIILLIIAGLGFLGFSFGELVARYLDFFVLGVIILVGGWLMKYFAKKVRVVKTWKLLVAQDAVSVETGWKQGLSVVSCIVGEPVQNVRVRIGKRYSGGVPAPDAVFCYANVVTNVPVLSVKNVSLIFKIKKKWLSRNGISEKDVRVVQWKNARWSRLNSSIVSSDKCFVYVEAVSDLLGAFAVSGKSFKPIEEKVSEEIARVERVEKEGEVVVEKKEEVREEKRVVVKPVGQKKKQWFAYIVLFVLLAGVFFAVSYLYSFTPAEIPQHVGDKGIPFQMWSQDEKQWLNVSEFFKDPDGDALSFSARSVENVRIAFDGDFAVFTPDAGWFGSRSTIFTASDGVHSVSSNEVQLIVKKSVIPQVIKPFVPQMVSGVLFVIVVVVLIVFREKIVKFLEEE